jgi:hypothetical protein
MDKNKELLDEFFKSNWVSKEVPEEQLIKLIKFTKSSTLKQVREIIKEFHINKLDIKDVQRVGVNQAIRDILNKELDEIK